MNLLGALQLLLNPYVLLALIAGEVLGLFIGAMPGLTATMGAALIVPFTYFMDPLAGIAMIVGLSTVAIFAGDIPAVLLRIPGTPASAAQTLDAYQLSRKHPLSTLVIDLVCSSMGGIIGALLLMFLSSLLAEFASNFSTVEYFWLALWGLSMAIVIAAESPIKGTIAVALGFLISSVGIDPVYGYPRFTLHRTELLNGISFIPVMIGLFAIPELIKQISASSKSFTINTLSETGVFNFVLKQVRKFKRVFITSALIGTFIGALPGAGADIAAWVAYGVGKRTSKNPEMYGKGAVEGVIASTSANNAAISGSWIPLLVFGIPGDSITAIALGTLLTHGLRPGPTLFEKYDTLTTGIFLAFIFANLMMLLVGYVGIRLSTNILKVPRNILVPIIATFSVVGAYAVNNSIFDVWIMFIFGIIGYFMERARIPLSSVVLAIILGPMVEFNFITTLIKANNDPLIFISRPIALGLAILTLVTWTLPILMSKLKGGRGV